MTCSADSYQVQKEKSLQMQNRFLKYVILYINLIGRNIVRPL